MAVNQIKIEQNQAIGARSNQEDRMGHSDPGKYKEKGFLAVLSDGMGGMDDGEKFSSIAVDEMLRRFDVLPPNTKMENVLLECYGAAHREALAQQSEDEKHRGGATVVAAYIRQSQCTIMSVGDSRIDLLRDNGMIQLNRLQVLGSYLDEKAALGNISWQEAAGNIKRSALLNHIGRRTDTGVDICTESFELFPGDRLILMSDGVFGTLDDPKIIIDINDAQSSGKDAAALVIKDVLEQKKPRQDNCSILLLTIE